MDTQLRRALLESCVLAVLCEGDSYGYRIVRAVAPHIPVTESTLYPILRRLETEGCLRVYSEEYNNRLRRYYAITDLGRKKIEEFLAEWEQAMQVYAYIRGTGTANNPGITTERSTTS